jgi:hypothetical protein
LRVERSGKLLVVANVPSMVLRADLAADSPTTHATILSKKNAN